MDISDRIKSARAALKLKQDEMSALMGMSIDTYKKYEGGLRKPGAEALGSFMGAGINANWLLGGDGPMLLRDLASPVRLVASDQVGAYQVQTPPGLDLERLQHAIATVEEALEQTRRTMEPARKAELVLAVYDLFQEPANTHDRVLKLVTLAA